MVNFLKEDRDVVDSSRLLSPLARYVGDDFQPLHCPYLHPRHFRQ
jgi:hypothetical protein